MSAAIKLISACKVDPSDDKVAVGELGWKVLEAHAAKEGVNDLFLFRV
jgi:hypothetical protein